MITNQKDLRRLFWSTYPELPRKRYRNGDRHVDARMAWVDWIDHLCRAGTISEALAQRATLDP